MKRIFLLILVLVCSLALFTGCGNSIEGKWHCIKLIANGDEISGREFYKTNGYEMNAVQMEFFKDGTGTFLYDFNFEWSGSADDLSIDFSAPFDASAKNTLKMSDDQLVLTIKLNGSKEVYYFEKGEADKDDIEEAQNILKDAAEKGNLKSANANAKLLYITIDTLCSDLVSDGNSSLIKTGYQPPISVDDLDDNNIIQAVILNLLDNGLPKNGYVAWEIDNYYNVSYAQWSEDNSGIVGQYPDPETDTNVVHAIGEKF